MDNFCVTLVRFGLFLRVTRGSVGQFLRYLSEFWTISARFSNEFWAISARYPVSSWIISARYSCKGQFLRCARCMILLHVAERNLNVDR